MRSENSSNSTLLMILNEIRAEMVTRTERKIQEMKARNIILPERRADLCELCDQLSQEIYDFAVNTTIQIADRNHFRGRTASLLDELHDDIYALTNGALDIIVAASGTGSAGGNKSASTHTMTTHFTRRPQPRKISPLQAIYTWIKGFRGYKAHLSGQYLDT